MMTFEHALARLESITQTLQSSQPLEQALALYSEGCELVQFCQQQLAQVEQKLQVLDQQQLKELHLDEQ